MDSLLLGLSPRSREAPRNYIPPKEEPLSAWDDAQWPDSDTKTVKNDDEMSGVDSFGIEGGCNYAHWTTSCWGDESRRDFHSEESDSCMRFPIAPKGPCFSETQWDDRATVYEEHHVRSRSRLTGRFAKVKQCEETIEEETHMYSKKRTTLVGQSFKCNPTRNTRARTGETSSRKVCNVYGCITLRKGLVANDDMHGVAGPRCVRHGGGRRCNVETCNNYAQRSVTVRDQFAEAGPRCRVHGGKKCQPIMGPASVVTTSAGDSTITTAATSVTTFVATTPTPPKSPATPSPSSSTRASNSPRPRARKLGGTRKLVRNCNVENCTSRGVSSVKSDEHGPKGWRCGVHGGSMACAFPNCSRAPRVRLPADEGARVLLCAFHSPCTVAGCLTPGRGVVHDADHFGPGGRRCRRHGAGSRCDVERCYTLARERATVEDKYGPEGNRCLRHFCGVPSVSARCNVDGCMTSDEGRVYVSDAFGPAGLRCKRHGGAKRCNVEGCGCNAKGKVDDSDELGAAGYRCRKHKGGPRCNVEGCGIQEKGKVYRMDHWGEEGPRCKKHGGVPRSNIMWV